VCGRLYYPAKASAGWLLMVRLTLNLSINDMIAQFKIPHREVVLRSFHCNRKNVLTAKEIAAAARRCRLEMS